MVGRLTSSCKRLSENSLSDPPREDQILVHVYKPRVGDFFHECVARDAREEVLGFSKTAPAPWLARNTQFRNPESQSAIVSPRPGFSERSTRLSQ